MKAIMQAASGAGSKTVTGKENSRRIRLCPRPSSRATIATALLFLASISAINASAQSGATTKPATMPSTDHDYRIAANDILRIEVWDLQGSGMSSAIIKRVANSGTITMPYIDHPLIVAGKTEAELEALLRHEYRQAQVLPQAVVNALVLEGSDGRTINPGYFTPGATTPAKH